jgi:hypothetical protein
LLLCDENYPRETMKKYSIECAYKLTKGKDTPAENSVRIDLITMDELQKK